MVRGAAIDNFGSRAEYEKNIHGRALELNLKEMENEALYLLDLIKKQHQLVDEEYNYDDDQEQLIIA